MPDGTGAGIDSLVLPYQLPWICHLSSRTCDIKPAFSVLSHRPSVLSNAPLSSPPFTFDPKQHPTIDEWNDLPGPDVSVFVPCVKIPFQ